MTPIEFSLLELLMRFAGQVVTRKMLCEHVWGFNWDGTTNVIEVHVNLCAANWIKGAANRTSPPCEDVGMPWRRLNTQFRSLRWRLTFWNTLVVLLAVVAALIGVREGLRYYLVEEMDRVLDDEVRELLSEIQEFYNPLDEQQEKIVDAMERKSQAHENDGWHVRWLDADRKNDLENAQKRSGISLGEKVAEGKAGRSGNLPITAPWSGRSGLDGIPITFVRSAQNWSLSIATSLG
ncbi:MAG: winged helix-turn-helix domain-containing protein [Planctomycetaceae bacterium]